MASDIQRATDGTFMHPSRTQRAADGLSPAPMLCLHPRHIPASGCWHPESDRQVFHAPNQLPESARRALSPAPNNAASRPPCSFEIASHRSLPPPRSRPLPAYQRRANVHPKGRQAGPLIHSKSRPSDSRHLPSLASQQSSPLASQSQAPQQLLAPNRPTGRPSRSFEIASW